MTINELVVASEEQTLALQDGYIAQIFLTQSISVGIIIYTKAMFYVTLALH